MTPTKPDGIIYAVLFGFRETGMRCFGWMGVIALLLTPLSAHSQNATPPQLPPPVGPAWNPSEVDIALNYAKESKFDLAFPIFKKHAEAGNLEAMYHLGVMYSYGEGMKPNKKEAIAWWLRAATSGHAASKNDLGAMYSKGEGIKADKKEAFRWFRASAEQGYAMGQRNLAQSYLYGDGVPKNPKLALKWFIAAAEQGDEPSHRELAEMYDRGKGVKRDPKEAFRWYAKSAVIGDQTAQLELGKRYFAGTGVERDVVKSRMWFRIVGGDGDVGSLITFNNGEISVGELSGSIRLVALKLVKVTEQAMSAEQVEEANRLREVCAAEEDPDKSLDACGLR